MALVIGNSSYTSVSALPNPANDAKAMATFLSSAGFQVMQAPDLTQSEMRKTVGNFARMVADKGPDTVALVFYAGHGVQVDGENFLIPIDAQIEREADVPLQAMRLVDVMNALAAVPSKSNIVILDACRNNPFSAINKTAGRGLAMVDAPKGSLVSYSTAPGTEALDGDGANSPFTTALTRIGQEPGLPIEQALKRVRLAVSKATDPNNQVPYESSSLTTEFSFFPTQSGEIRPTPVKAGPTSTTEAARSSQPRSVESWRNELRSKNPRDAYDIVISEDKVEAYQAYLALYPSQSTAPVVRTILERRQVMIAWYTAVTINTVASYRSFLASYANSDFALTANRLVERALTRSVSNAGAAFAAAPTCPCTQPVSPLPRQKRTDAPTQNFNSNPGNPGGTNVVVNNPPTVVRTDPVPPVVVIPPKPPIVVIPPKPPIVVVIPPKGGHDKPPTGGDKPPQTGGGKPPYDKPPKSTGIDPKTTGNPPITKVYTNPRVQLNNNPVHINKSVGTTTVRSTSTTGFSVKPQSSGSMGMTRSSSFGRMGIR